MKHSAIFLIAIVISVTLLSGQVHAGNRKNYEYEQCLLENLQGVTQYQDWVAKEIKRICKENYLNIRQPSKKKQNYNQCLLTFLLGVESKLAAQEIIETCRQRHLSPIYNR